MKRLQKPDCGCGCECERPAGPDPVPYSIPADNGPPADPLSVSLAYNIHQAKQFSVPESKLSYGFHKTPINGLPTITKSSIQEEKLWKGNPRFKPIELKRTHSYSAPEEDEEHEEETEEEAPADMPTPYLSYGDLGYGPAAYKNNKFRSIVNEPIVVEAKKGDYSCGFKPGQIANRAPVVNDFLYGGNENCFGGL